MHTAVYIYNKTSTYITGFSIIYSVLINFKFVFARSLFIFWILSRIQLELEKYHDLGGLTDTYLPSYNFSQSNGMDCILIFLCFIIPSIHGYSLKINPHIQTAVNTLQARGSNNTLSFSQISNATILNAILAQIQQSHQNELISFSKPW